MGLPLVSIIIPCYNAEKWIAQAIESALAQTYPNCEIIVIDDGSTDESVKVIESFSQYVVFRSQANCGGCAARNVGLGLARGEWIQFLDADDWMSPSKLSAQLSILDNPSRGIVGTCTWSTSDSNDLHRSQNFSYADYRDPRSLLTAIWLRGDFFPPHAWITPRSIIDRAGIWDEELVADQDGDFFGRVLLTANGVYFSDKTSVTYRTPGSSNVSQRRCAAELASRISVIEKIAPSLLEHSPHGAQAVAKRLADLAVRESIFHPDVARDLLGKAHMFSKTPFKYNRSILLRIASRCIGAQAAMKLRALLYTQIANSLT